MTAPDSYSEFFGARLEGIFAGVETKLEEIRRRYPKELTTDVLLEWAHVANEELRHDIAELQLAVHCLRLVAQTESTLRWGIVDRGVAHDAAHRFHILVAQVMEREAFAEFLTRLLVARGGA